MRRTVWAWARVVAPAATLAVLVWRLGTGPFLQGVRTIDGGALADSGGHRACSRPCAAPGAGGSWPAGSASSCRCPRAVAAYYRSLFLNVTLPGGIVGDVHRAVSHGRDVSDVGRAVRAVAWERSAGQVVQAVLTVVVLLALPSPVQSSMPLVAVAVVVAALGSRARGSGASRWRSVRVGPGPEDAGRRHPRRAARS